MTVHICLNGLYHVYNTFGIFCRSTSDPESLVIGQQESQISIDFSWFRVLILFQQYLERLKILLSKYFPIIVLSKRVTLALTEIGLEVKCLLLREFYKTFTSCLQSYVIKTPSNPTFV